MKALNMPEPHENATVCYDEQSCSLVAQSKMTHILTHSRSTIHVERFRVICDPKHNRASAVETGMPTGCDP